MSAPLGQRFSHTYLSRSAPANDSERLRRRLASKVAEICRDWQVESLFGKHLVVEAGVEIEQYGGSYDVGAVFEKGPVRDVLDAITLFYQFLTKHRITVPIEQGSGHRSSYQTSTAADEVWRGFVERALREENVGYRVDSKCGVHYYVDEEFERNRATTVVVLEHPLLANARAAHDDAYRHMDTQPRDTKAAVRSIFEAAEIIGKSICPEAKNLNRRLAEGTLKERCIGNAAVDETEKTVLAGMFDSFGPWIDAVHFYRHGQPGEKAVAPSDELAVHVLSTGSAFVRLLASAQLRLQAA